jgi:hypothetical protein
MSVYGTWYVSYWDENGKRHRESTGLKTEKEKRRNKKKAAQILEDKKSKVRDIKFGNHCARNDQQRALVNKSHAQ